MVNTKEFSSALGMLIWKFPMKDRITFSTVLIGNGESCGLKIFLFFFGDYHLLHLSILHILNFIS